ncbi:helix-turn-helix domain-containing protein [Saccharopolyspora elongata]|uniref:helix-turn-helix domain-containing protein n=1 Tax=Saccharopolyspora elongata TaxID=2530387 RepID=UPI001A9DC091|nr:helix-turn-helix domain-containing protein [Saccharopolyspora elongata]
MCSSYALRTPPRWRGPGISSSAGNLVEPTPAVAAGIHAELRTGADSVSDVAHRWGFTHLGRFASSYRKRFGVHPSQTLRNGGV